MVPTTKHEQTSVQDIEGFYDALAPDYDTMTGFEKRFVQERPFFRVLVERFKIKSALDAGCGSGFHSLLLAQLGVQVTGVDISAEMLRRVEQHARDLNVHVKALRGTFQELDRVVRGRFDAVFSLGNSLPHILTLKELTRALRNFGSLLNPQGILFVQNLNYDRILAKRDRVQSSKEIGNKTFVRFYDYDEKGILFNILTLDKSKGTVEQKLETVRLRPPLQDELLKCLVDTGFSDIQSFGTISMEAFDPTKSKDLVVLAQKRM
jgi:glycine/sarcosine N-methyltransferase